MTNLCVCPPFKKSFTSGETPGPGLWRLYISIHNWWPGPRQTAHYTCNMDSLLVSDACPRLDLTLSHHCVWSWNGEGMAYVYGRLTTCARVFTCVCVWYGCYSQKYNRPTLCSPAQVWLMLWLLIPSLAFQISVFRTISLTSYQLLILFHTYFGSCAPLRQTQA